jgi:hypothetical protein
MYLFISWTVGEPTGVNLVVVVTGRLSDSP